MSHKKNRLNRDHTDVTDYLYTYLMNDDKINDQLAEELEKEYEKKICDMQPVLDSRVEDIFSSSEIAPEELPSVSSYEPSPKRLNQNVAFRENSVSARQSSPRKSSQKKTESFYQTYKPASVQASIPAIVEPAQVAQAAQAVQAVQPVQPQKPVIQETYEQRRRRAQDNLARLDELHEKYGVNLRRSFTINDDPDLMEEEFIWHKAARAKKNQVKFYGRILVDMIAGAEFLSETYNPFGFKLKGWSKQVGSELEEYEEIIEELYEKYKGPGSGMPPEIRLILLILVSGVSFHISNAMFSGSGLDSVLAANPALAAKAIKSMAGKGVNMLTKNKTNSDEPPITKHSPSKSLIARIKEQNSKKNETTEQATSSVSNRSNESNMSETKKASDELIAEQARMLEDQARLLSDQRKEYTEQMRSLNDKFKSLENKLSATMSDRSPNNNNNNNNNFYDNYESARLSSVFEPSKGHIRKPPARTLSDARTRPRFLTNPVLSESNPDDLFSSEVPFSEKFATESPAKKSPLHDMLESLENTSDIDKLVIKTPGKNPPSGNKTPSGKKPPKKSRRNNVSSVTRLKI